MNEDTSSIAPSEATTLVNEPVQQERTTLTGRPIQRHHDNLGNIMLEDGGGAFGAGVAGVNLLPPGYTDKSLVRIPIKLSDIPGFEPTEPAKKKGFFKKLSGVSSSGDQIKVVMMSRGDYLKYWAKGDDGKFLDSVQEPPGGRKAWFKNQLEINEEWKRKDPTLGKPSKPA